MWKHLRRGSRTALAGWGAPWFRGQCCLHVLACRGLEISIEWWQEKAFALCNLTWLPGASPLQLSSGSTLMNTTAPTCHQAGRNGSASSKTPAFITTRCVGMEWRRNTALTTPRWVPLAGWGGSGAQPWGSGLPGLRLWHLHARLWQPSNTLCFSFFISQIIVSVSKSTVLFFIFFKSK